MSAGAHLQAAGRSTNDIVYTSEKFGCDFKPHSGEAPELYRWRSRPSASICR